MSTITPGPEGLRALSHPLRLRIVGMLRIGGPATASSLARTLGLNSGATSYHLRQLATHGFIVEAPDLGNGRERWWRAAHDATETSATSRHDDPETEFAYLHAVAATYTEYLARGAARYPALPPQWQEPSAMSDWVTAMSPRQALALTTRLRGVIEEFMSEVDAAEPEEGALPFVVNVNTLVWPEVPLPEVPDPSAPESASESTPTPGSAPDSLPGSAQPGADPS